MQKVKNIWLFDQNERKQLGDYSTGLLIELEDGKLLTQVSTDIIVMWSSVDYNKLLQRKNQKLTEE